jgi:hypothetical protein
VIFVLRQAIYRHRLGQQGVPAGDGGDGGDGGGADDLEAMRIEALEDDTFKYQGSDWSKTVVAGCMDVAIKAVVSNVEVKLACSDLKRSKRADAAFLRFEETICEETFKGIPWRYNSADRVFLTVRHVPPTRVGLL